VLAVDEAVRVAGLPLQIVKDGEAVTVTDGTAFTVTVRVWLAEHPELAVTVAV
jgi:hypothetical protein